MLTEFWDKRAKEKKGLTPSEVWSTDFTVSLDCGPITWIVIVGTISDFFSVRMLRIYIVNDNI